jgi:hypothetical protein
MDLNLGCSQLFSALPLAAFTAITNQLQYLKLKLANREIIVCNELHKNDCKWFNIHGHKLAFGFGEGSSNNHHKVSPHFIVETNKISNLMICSMMKLATSYMGTSVSNKLQKSEQYP